MYKMYNAQWEDESDDDKNSLNSSFWSDGEREEEEEEEVEIERVIGEEDSKPEGSLQEPSEGEKPELNNKGNVCGDSLEGGRGDDDDDDEEICSSSSDSPAPSLMTSGYGTCRPEEQEGGDYRDDHTITEFDQDSRGDLSEMRDNEDDDEDDVRSLCSFGGFDIDPTEPDYSESRPLSALADAKPEANVACCGFDGPHEEVDVTDMKPEEDEDLTDEEKSEVLRATSEEEEQHHTTVDKYVFDGKRVEGGNVDVEGGKQNDRREEEVQDLKEDEDKMESEDQDESSSNKDIKFIDSKVDFRWMMYNKMCEEFEGNLRQKKGKWFPVSVMSRLCFVFSKL